MRPWRRFVCRLLIVLTAVIATDVALCYVLEPYAGSTELMWSEYRKADTIDTVFVGSSATGYGIAPDVFDAALGTHSFNMGTPGQTIHDSVTSLKQAKRDHDISRAVICVGYETILEYPYINSSVIYTQAKCVDEPVPQVFSDVVDLVGYPYYFSKIYSLSCAFPWAYNHVDLTPDAISANIDRRLNQDTLQAAAAYAEASNDEGWDYWGQGYDGYTTLMGTSFAHGFRFSSHPADSPLIQETLTDFDALCAYCQEAGIKLYVVGAAYVPSALIEYGQSYQQGMAQVQKIAEDHGATFFDLNMLHRELFEQDRSLYFNQVHLNRAGAERASATIAEVISRAEEGEDITNLSFPYTAEGCEDWLASLDYVDAVDYASMLDGTRVLVEAQATTGPKTVVEYRLERQEGENGAWELIRDWEANPVFEFQGTPDTRVRLQARARGTQTDTREVTGPII